jgi:hypothetical protein
MRALKQLTARLPFPSRQQRRIARRRERHATRSHTSLGIQALESRQLLAFTTRSVQLTSSPSDPTFAWVIAIDDVVNSEGDGRNLFMQAATDGSPYFLVSTNPNFANATRLGMNLAGFGTNTTVLVTSSNSTFASGAPGGDLPPGRGPTSGSFAQSFTFQSSSLVPTQRLIVDLSPEGSRISMESPWNPTNGRNPPSGTIGVDIDWTGYRSYGGYLTIGQGAFFASEVNIASPMTVASRFTADSSEWRNSSFPVNLPVRTVNIAAAVSADDTRVQPVGNSSASPPAPGLLRVSTAGSLTGSKVDSTLNVNARGADIRFEGLVEVPIQTFLLGQIPGLNPDPNAHVFTTRSQSSGQQTGTLRGTSRTSITTGNPSGGLIDLKTDLGTLVFQSGLGADGQPYRYSVNIEETDGLQVDAVGSSKGPISIKTGGAGNLTVLGEAIQTSGDLAFIAGGQLLVNGAISSANGNVSLGATKLDLGSAVQAGGSRSVSIQTSNGNAVVNALAQAGGRVLQTVRVASRQNVSLAAPGGAIDGVTLAPDDRILLKNQLDGRENGIWVFNGAAAALTRATDANTPAELVPGLTVYAREGTQEGGWTLSNRTAPQFVGTTNQTPLTFEPTAVVQSYANVRVATTTQLISLAGQPAVDGIALNAGDRVLVKNQSNEAQNGIYVVPVDPAGAWVRAGDANRTDQLRANSYVFVQEGSTQAGSGWVLQQDAVAVGVTPLQFVQYARQTQVTGQAPAATLWRPADVLADVAIATTVDVPLSGVAPIDGVVPVAGTDLVLVKNQIDATKNGIYRAEAGAWTPVVTGASLERGATVYVQDGAFNANSSWQFNDDSLLLGAMTANSVVVTGLSSTEVLRVGMLVSGTGIPAATTIAQITGTDSIRLSTNATLTNARASLRFASTTPVTGSTPVSFIPVGGSVTVTASQALLGGGTFQGAMGLVNAFGTEQTGSNADRSIQMNTNLGRLTARAPGHIDIETTPTGIREIELRSVTTTDNGKITAVAAGSLAALAVDAKGSVSLTSTFGNLLAESVKADNGSVNLTALNGDLNVVPIRLPAAQVQSVQGNVVATADNGDILVNGEVLAQSPGADIDFTSNAGALSIGALADIRANERLTINTPNKTPLDTAPPPAEERVFAERLALTAPFGGTKYPQFLGTRYSFLDLNRTDNGPIDITVTKALTIEGAQTKDGSITFAAPSITVAGLIRVGGTNNIELIANSANLNVDQQLQAPGNITLRAPLGRIARSDESRTPLLEAGNTLFIEAASGATVSSKVAKFDAQLTAPGAVLDLIESDALEISRVLLTNGGTATLVIGNDQTSDAVVGSIDVGAAGVVNLTSSLDIEAVPAPAVSLIRAGTASLESTNGRIDARTDVDVLRAISRQPNQQVTIRDVGTGARILDLEVVETNSANIDIQASRTIRARDVSTAGDVFIQSTGGKLLVEKVEARGSRAVLTAAGAILEDPVVAGAEITASTVSLESQTGSINVEIDAAAVAARALTAGSEIRIRHASGSLSIGDAGSNLGIEGRNVVLEVAGNLGQTHAIVVDSLDVAATAGAVTLTHAGNSVGGVRIDNADRAISFKNAIATRLDGLTGGTIDVESAGAITQTAVINAATLAVRATTPGATVSLVAPANNVGTLSGGTNTGTFRFVNAGNLSVGAPGITAGTGAFNDGDIELTSENGNLEIISNLTADNDVVVLNAVNGTILQQSGSVINAGLLRWNARSATFNGTIPAAVVPPPPPGEIQIGPAVPGQTLVVAAGNYTGNVVIVNSGDIRIDGVVTATGTITVTSQTGAVTFGSAGRLDGSSVSLAAVNNSELIVGGGMPVSATVSAGSLTLSSPGSLRQNGAITATALSATAGSGAITLDNQNNAIGVGGFSASAPHTGGNVVFVNAGGFSVAAPGINAGTTAVGDGFVSLTALTGDLTVGAPINAPGDLVLLRARGRVVSPTAPIDAQSLFIIDSSGVSAQPIPVATSQALVDSVALINSLPGIPGGYQIIVTASLTLTQTLTFSNVIALSGAPGVVIDGGGTLAEGVVIAGDPAVPNSLGSGSSITNLAFANFTGAAVSVNNAQNVSIQRLTVTDSATGLLLNGFVKDTTVRGSTFRNVQTAMQLTGAQRATIGGTATSQRNRIEGASRAGVLATGFCTATRIFGTTFTANPRTRTQFNVRSSRGLRISGTTVERAPRVVRAPINLFGR